MMFVKLKTVCQTILRRSNLEHFFHIDVFVDCTCLFFEYQVLYVARVTSEVSSFSLILHNILFHILGFLLLSAKLQEGNVFSRVCQSFCSQWGEG